VPIMRVCTGCGKIVKDKTLLFCPNCNDPINEKEFFDLEDFEERIYQYTLKRVKKSLLYTVLGITGLIVIAGFASLIFIYFQGIESINNKISSKVEEEFKGERIGNVVERVGKNEAHQIMSDEIKPIIDNLKIETAKQIEDAKIETAKKLEEIKVETAKNVEEIKNQPNFHQHFAHLFTGIPAKILKKFQDAKNYKSKEDFKKASEIFDEVITETNKLKIDFKEYSQNAYNETLSDIYSEACICNNYLDENEKAYSYCEKALKYEKNNLNYYNLSTCAYNLGNIEEALKYFKEASSEPKKLDMDESWISSLKAKIFRELVKNGFEEIKQDNLQEAQRLFAIVVENGDAEPLNKISRTFSTSKDESLLNGPEAVKYAEMANKLAPDKPHFLDTLACAYAQNGKFDKAIKTQKRAIALLKKSKDYDEKKQAELLKNLTEKLPVFESGQKYFE
jgi:tetratricopeptide (TPR) repeat protein